MIIFGICSSINGYNKGVYSTQDRFEQTIQTINSIKKLNLNTYIILCDNSDISNEHKNDLVKNVNLFIQSNNNMDSKSYSESQQMIQIINNINNLEYDVFFKISGRYFLKNNFDFNQYNNDKINFREFNYDGRFCYSTVLYSFSKKHEEFMKSNYEKFIIERSAVDIETGLYNMINNVVNKIKNLGVAGNIAPSGEYLEH
jgi:hypothetical protein